MTIDTAIEVCAMDAESWWVGKRNWKEKIYVSWIEDFKKPSKLMLKIINWMQEILKSIWIYWENNSI